MKNVENKAMLKYISQFQMTGLQSLTREYVNFLWISEPYFDINDFFLKLHYIKQEAILKRLQEPFEGEIREVQHISPAAVHSSSN